MNPLQQTFKPIPSQVPASFPATVQEEYEYYDEEEPP